MSPGFFSSRGFASLMLDDGLMLVLDGPVLVE
jgi:hypothetical protein